MINTASWWGKVCRTRWLTTNLEALWSDIAYSRSFVNSDFRRVRDNSASIFRAVLKLFRNFLNLHIALFKHNKIRNKPDINESYLTPEDTVTPPTKDRNYTRSTYRPPGQYISPHIQRCDLCGAEFTWKNEDDSSTQCLEGAYYTSSSTPTGNGCVLQRAGVSCQRVLEAPTDRRRQIQEHGIASLEAACRLIGSPAGSLSHMRRLEVGINLATRHAVTEGASHTRPPRSRTGRRKIVKWQNNMATLYLR